MLLSFYRCRPKEINIHAYYEDMDRPQGGILSSKECMAGMLDAEKNDPSKGIPCKTTYGCNHYNYITNPAVIMTTFGGMMTQCKTLANQSYTTSPMWKWVFHYK
jgi:hypothetical protein